MTYRQLLLRYRDLYTRGVLQPANPNGLRPFLKFLCRNCLMFDIEHVDQKCLYEPTNYEGLNELEAEIIYGRLIGPERERYRDQEMSIP